MAFKMKGSAFKLGNVATKSAFKQTPAREDKYNFPGQILSDEERYQMFHIKKGLNTKEGREKHIANLKSRYPGRSEEWYNQSTDNAWKNSKTEEEIRKNNEYYK